jgi:hypothetical protein
MRLFVVDGGRDKVVAPSVLYEVAGGGGGGDPDAPPDLRVVDYARQVPPTAHLRTLAAIRLAPAAPGDPRADFDNFAKYLHHGVAGTSAPKAAVMRRGAAGDGGSAGGGVGVGAILLLPPPTLPTDSLVVAVVVDPRAEAAAQAARAAAPAAHQRDWYPAIDAATASAVAALALPPAAAAAAGGAAAGGARAPAPAPAAAAAPAGGIDVADVAAVLPTNVSPAIAEAVAAAHRKLRELAAQVKALDAADAAAEAAAEAGEAAAADAAGAANPAMGAAGRGGKRPREGEAAGGQGAAKRQHGGEEAGAPSSSAARPQDVYSFHGEEYVPRAQVAAARRGTPAAAALADALVARIVRGEVAFPFKRNFIRPRELLDWFDKLAAYRVDARVCAAPYPLYGYFHEGKTAACVVEDDPLPPAFRRPGTGPPASSAAAGGGGGSGLRTVQLSEAQMLRFAGRAPLLIPFDKAMQVQDTALVDAFTEEARAISRRKDEPSSIVDLFRTPDVARRAVDKAAGKYGELTEFSLRHGLFGVVGGPSLFKAQVALACYELFGAARVFDMCAGWGVHLLGALASPRVRRYQAFEPNTTLRVGHGTMADVFARRGGGGAFHVQYVPFEAGVVEAGEAGTFDLVFTSPPYFDVEVYQSAQPGDHGAQSIQSFPSLHAWLRGWLFPAMDKAYAALRPGGHMALYINDFEGLHMCRPMVDYAATMPDCRWLGIIGVEGETGKTRPLWVWRKGPLTRMCPLYRLAFPGEVAEGLEE